MDEWFHYWVRDSHDWVVNRSQLLPLGITDKHLHFFFGMVGIILLYYMFHPIIRWMMMLKWERMLTYLVSGVCLLLLMISFEMYQQVTGSGNLEFSDVASGSLAMISFGLFLFASHMMQRLVIYMKKQRGRSL